ncbi:MAG: response regulator, partial [Desulfobacterales bacterium]|nr:response regulator [Desulfobacterales bacterium]
KILLVDDEKALLDVLNRIISNLGYDVEAYHDSIRALEAFTRKTDHFDLLITDQVMPDLTGTQLIRKVRAKNTAIPVILLTGFDEVRYEKTGSNQLRFDKILKKPLLNSDLAYAIRKILDGKPNR